MASSAKVEAHLSDIVAKIVASLEKGEIPWHKPWDGTSMVPHNFATGKEYNGLNFLLMLMSGRSDTRWAGYKQAKKMGATVRKGEKAFYGLRPRMIRHPEGLTKNGKPVMVCIGFAVFAAFNAEQMDGTPEIEVIDEIDPSIGFEKAAAVLAKSKAVVGHGGNRACYSPSSDEITLPPAGAFTSVAHYWATAMHELVHWTGHSERMNREGVGQTLRTRESYAFEELVAEMGSAFLCHELGISRPEIFKNHEAYIGSWIRCLKKDPRKISEAAGQANRAIKFLREL